jgi:hypothetical protein
MKWNEDMYVQNTVEAREAASTLARLIVDEAEAYVAATPDCDDSVQQIVDERTDMLLDALYTRINQQLIVRGHIED